MGCIVIDRVMLLLTQTCIMSYIIRIRALDTSRSFPSYNLFTYDMPFNKSNYIN